MTSGPRTSEAPAEYFGTEVVRANLQALLEFGPRTVRNAGALDATLHFLESTLASCGYDTQLVHFGEKPGDCNLLAQRPGTDPEAPLLEIGAHYDTVDDSPGADDNGSGVIGLLALARYFSLRQLQRSLRFCFFGAEETGLRGSHAHQEYLTREGRAFAGCVVFEMIGYRSHASRSQETPLRVPLLLWPPRTGDFIASVTNWRSRHLATAYRRAASSTRGPSLSSLINISSGIRCHICWQFERKCQSKLWSSQRKQISQLGSFCIPIDKGSFSSVKPLLHTFPRRVLLRL